MEETSSIAHVVGLYVMVLGNGSLLKKSLIRSRKEPKQAFLGWQVALEPPFARPRAPDEKRQGRARSQSRGRRPRSASRSSGRNLASPATARSKSPNRAKGHLQGKGQEKGKGKGKGKGKWKATEKARDLN